MLGASHFRSQHSRIERERWREQKKRPLHVSNQWFPLNCGPAINHEPLGRALTIIVHSHIQHSCLSVNHLTCVTLQCVSLWHHYPFGRSHPVLSDTDPYSHEVISYQFQVGSRTVMCWWYCPWEPLRNKTALNKRLSKNKSVIIKFPLVV